MTFWCPRRDCWADLDTCQAKAQRRDRGCVSCKARKEAAQVQPSLPLKSKQTSKVRRFA